MEGGGTGDDEALSGEGACETEDGAGDLVDFGEEDDGGEGGVGVVGDGGVDEEDAHGGGEGGKEVAVGFFEEDHGCCGRGGLRVGIGLRMLESWFGGWMWNWSCPAGLAG